MRFYLFIWFLTAMILPSSSFSQSCIDWSVSISRPATAPDIKGNVCQIDEHICYVACDSLQIIDISNIDAPEVLGTVGLPATAKDMLINDYRVYITCESDGMVEIDCFDISHPTISRRYLQGEDVYDLAIVGESLIVSDMDWNLHVLDLSNDWPFYPLTAFQSPTSYPMLSHVGHYLIVAGGVGAFTFDFTNPRLPTQIDDYSTNAMYGFAKMSINDNTLYLIDATEYGYFEYVYYTHFVEVDQDGQFHRLNWFESGLTDIIACDGRVLMPVHKGCVVKSLPELSFITQVKHAYGSGNRYKYALSHDRIAAVHHENGLTLWDASHWPDVSPTESGKIFNERTAGAYVFHSSRSTSYDGAGGGWSSTDRIQLYDYSSPLSPTLLHAMSFSSSSVDESYLGYYSGSFVCADWFKIFYSGPWGNGAQFFNMASGDEIGSVSGNSMIAESNQIWAWDWWSTRVKRYEIDPDLGLSLMAEYTVDAEIRGIQIAGQDALMIMDESTFTTYDTTNNQLTPLGSIPRIPYDTFKWIDSKLLLAKDETLACWDYQDLSNPRLLFEQTVEGDVQSIHVGNNILTFVYSNNEAQPRCQMFRLDDGNPLQALTPVLSLQVYNIVWDEQMAYISTRSGIQLWDFEDLENPTWIGTQGESGFVRRIGNYVLSGKLVYPMHCKNVQSVPEVILLAQNYPNPFNPNTSIPYAIPKSGQASLKIYDIRGRLVKTLIDGPIDAGEYEAEWSATDSKGHPVPAGVYLFELKTDDDTRTGKMALIR